LHVNTEINDTTKRIKLDSITTPCENTGRKLWYPHKTKNRKFWTKEEVGILKKLYEIDGKSLSEIEKIITNKSSVAIHLKIKRLQLQHTKEQKQKIWSEVRLGDKNPMYGVKSAKLGHTKYTMESIRGGRRKSIKNY
jgi:predicted ATP-dependent endonuclease of OLD family